MNKETDYMIDSQGRRVPINLVSDVDKLRDGTVNAVVQQALAMRETLSQFKQHMRDEVTTFLGLSFEQYGKKMGGKKGNVTLMSYDGQYKVMVAVNEYIVFDERLQIAKSIIDDCIIRWSEGSRSEIQALVNDAFYVDRTGKINTTRILGLRRLQIDDPEWLKAMQAITDSIQVAGSKEYLRIYERDESGEYRQVALDIAAL